jgi:hypothetical protein
MNDASVVCARLLRQGAVLRSELPELDYPEVQAEVERRLAQVGLMLAASVYSEYVGLRLVPEVTADSAFDAASNLGLNADHCALLVVLWSYLSLQKRTATESREIPGQNALFARDRTEAAKKYIPSVRIETIAREFGGQFVSYGRVKGLVGTLRRLKFIGGSGDIVEPGPLLELAIDGERMIAFVQREPLADLLKKLENGAAGEEAPENEAEQKVLEALRGARSAGLQMGELERATGMTRANLTKILRNLKTQGKALQIGTGYNTRYRAAEEN